MHVLLYFSLTDTQTFQCLLNGITVTLHYPSWRVALDTVECYRQFKKRLKNSVIKNH